MAQAKIRVIGNGQGNEQGSQQGNEQSKLTDEFDIFVDCRYVGPREALWRIYGFPICSQTVNVVRLGLYEEGRHRIYFHEGGEPNPAKTMKLLES